MRFGRFAMLRASLLVTVVCASPLPATAASLVSGLGGARGYGENVLAANDDGSTGAIDITSVFGASGINFYGTNFTALYVNNNGNVSFGNSTSEYSPPPLDTTTDKLIGAWWGDVDTGGAHVPAGSNLVYYDIDPAGGAVTITWDLVGYFPSQTDLLNAFQIRLINRGSGDFDIEFRFSQLQWANAARAGFTAGNGTNFYEFAESGIPSEMLQLVNRSNVSDPGRFVFQSRAGVITPGDEAWLDKTFDSDGRVTTDFGPGGPNMLAVAFQGDNKIVAVGRAGTYPAYDLAVARYNPDGSLDTTFSGDGKYTLNVAGETDIGYDVAIQGDGRIVVVGAAFNGSESYNVFLVRLLTDGTLDTSFSGDGRQFGNYGGDDRAHGVAIQPDGKIVIGGMRNDGASSDFLVARFNTDGSPDTTFSGDGVSWNDFGNDYDQGNDVALTPDGKIVVAGFSTNTGDDYFSLIRYNSDGSLDTSFSGDGKQQILLGVDGGAANGVVVQPDGKIVMAGFASNGIPGDNNDFALMRINTDGSLDSSFGTGGTVISPITNAGNDVARSVVLRSDGRIVAGGFASPSGNFDFAVARYNSNGTLDTSFAGDGKATTPIGSGDDQGFGVGVDSNSRTVLAGYTFNGTDNVVAIVRYVEPVCGNSSLEPGERCDDGGVVSGDCCSATCQYEASASPCASDGEPCTLDQCNATGTCAHPAGNGGTTCRSAAGPCDAEEVCSGFSTSCPADAKRTDECRASAGACDLAETCDGISDSCPADAKSTSECRGLAGACDVAETCDGVSDFCPADVKSTSPCRGLGGECDAVESCDGVNDDCPADAKQPGGTACSTDGNVCTNDICDGAGDACTHPDNSAPCDDGQFCTGADTCSGGTCSLHAGDPCTGGSECADACNEAADNCFDAAATACSADGNVCTDDVCDGAGGCGVNNTAPCDDGLFCTGTDTCGGGVCNHSGDPCPGTDCNTCQEDTNNCFDPIATPCLDEGTQHSECTNDRCDGAGACTHTPITLAHLCNWAVVGGNGVQSSKVRTRLSVQIGGGVCADKGDVGVNSTLDDATWAALHDTGGAMRFRGNATFGTGSVVTGGGCVKGGADTDILGTGLSEICCDDGIVPLAGGGVVNACGTDPKVGECTTAIAQVANNIAILAGLAQTQDVGALSCSPSEPCTIQAPANLNVIDASKLAIQTDGVLTIDAMGNTDAVVVLRVARGVKSKPYGQLLLAGGMQAKNLAIYAIEGGCTFGDFNEGSGALFCPAGKVQLKLNTVWHGSIGAGSSITLRDNSVIDHVPFLGLAD